MGWLPPRWFRDPSRGRTQGKGGAGLWVRLGVAVRLSRGVQQLCSPADAPLPEKEALYPAESALAALPTGAPFHVCSPTAVPTTVPPSPTSLGSTDPLTILSRNATHPLLRVSTLYEAREEEDGASRAAPEVGSLIAIPPPQQLLIATFDEPRTVVSTVEF